jgi:hypothetical protein
MKRVLVSLQSWLPQTQYEAKKMIVTFILWLIWKAHPGVVICAAFWLSMIWIVHSKRLIRYSAGSIVLLGIILNALVTEWNGGVMPVVGMPKYFRAASPVWQAAQTSDHLLLLADHASLQFFSVGDLVLMIGVSMFVFLQLYQKLPKRAYAMKTIVRHELGLEEAAAERGRPPLESESGMVEH